MVKGESVPWCVIFEAKLIPGSFSTHKNDLGQRRSRLTAWPLHPMPSNSHYHRQPISGQAVWIHSWVHIFRLAISGQRGNSDFGRKSKKLLQLTVMVHGSMHALDINHLRLHGDSIQFPQFTLPLSLVLYIFTRSVRPRVCPWTVLLFFWPGQCNQLLPCTHYTHEYTVLTSLQSLWLWLRDSCLSCFILHKNKKNKKITLNLQKGQLTMFFW